MASAGTIQVRVRYTEVDRMGVAHHRSHFVWFEMGRTELMRSRGLPYATFAYRIERESDGRLMATGTTAHAAVDAKGRPRRFPENVRRLLG